MVYWGKITDDSYRQEDNFPLVLLEKWGVRSVEGYIRRHVAVIMMEYT